MTSFLRKFCRNAWSCSQFKHRHTHTRQTYINIQHTSTQTWRVPTEEHTPIHSHYSIFNRWSHYRYSNHQTPPCYFQQSPWACNLLDFAACFVHHIVSSLLFHLLVRIQSSPPILGITSISCSPTVFSKDKTLSHHLGFFHRSPSCTLLPTADYVTSITLSTYHPLLLWLQDSSLSLRKTTVSGHASITTFRTKLQ